MRKSINKHKKTLFSTDKDNRASKIIYRKVKERVFAKDFKLDGWIDTENEISYSK